MVYTDEHVGRREILNNYRLDVHADESNQHPVAGDTGSFITVPHTTASDPVSSYFTQWAFDHPLVDTNENAGQHKFLHNHGPYINTGGSNQPIMADTIDFFTPAPPTLSVQTSNYRIHRTLEPIRMSACPSPYLSELVRSVRAFQAPSTVEQECGALMSTGVIQVSTITLQLTYALNMFQAVDDVVITGQSLPPPRCDRQPQCMLAATPGPSIEDPKIGAPVDTRSCVSMDVQKSIISKAKK